MTTAPAQTMDEVIRSGLVERIEAQALLIESLTKAMEEIASLGSDGEHSGDRHARCRDIARTALAQARAGKHRNPS